MILWFSFYILPIKLWRVHIKYKIYYVPTIFNLAWKCYFQQPYNLLEKYFEKVFFKIISHICIQFYKMLFINSINRNKINVKLWMCRCICHVLSRYFVTNFRVCVYVGLQFYFNKFIIFYYFFNSHLILYKIFLHKVLFTEN